MATNNDIKYISFTFENEEQSNISPNDVEVEIIALDQYKIAEYKFNSSIDTLFSEVNEGFVYTHTDIDNGDGTITRTIYSDQLPTKIRFEDCEGLLEVLYLNTSELTTLRKTFKNCYNVTSINTTDWNTSNITSLYEAFEGCNQLTTLDVSNFNTSNVTDMYGMFDDCSSLTSIDVSNFDTGNVTNMGYMFANCKNLTTLDVSNFDTNNVTDMYAMFSNCNHLTSLDVSNFDTSKVTNMNGMFRDCTKLEMLTGLNNFDVSKVTHMNMMFHNLPLITSLDLSSWNTDSLIYTTNDNENGGMFSGCINLQSIAFGEGWNTSQVTNMKYMFSNCNHLTSLDVSNFDTSNVTDMQHMFEDCHNITSLNLSNFDTRNVTNMQYMFEDCHNITSLNLSNFDTRNVTDMTQMINECYDLTELNMSNWYLNSEVVVTDMFTDTNILTRVTMNNSDYNSINKIIDNLPTRTSAKQGNLYIGSMDLTSVNTSDAEAKYWNILGYKEQVIAKYKFNNTLYDLIPEFNSTFTDYTYEDVVEGEVTTRIIYSNSLPTMIRFGSSNDSSTNRESSLLEIIELKTDNLTTMSYMFSNCGNLTYINSSNWDTNNVTNMAKMFYNCSSLSSLDVSNFNTNKVTNMNSMFHNCNSLTTLDLSNWDTSNVTNMGSMFNNCISLIKLEMKNWKINKDSQLASMFSRCSSLTELDLSSWENLPFMIYGMFYGCKKLKTLNLNNICINEEPYMSNYYFYECESLNNITMQNSDYSSVNKIISQLPTRTTDSIGTLDIVGVDDYSQVDITTAESKFWNIENGVEQIKIVEYRFNNSSDLVPVFNEGFVYSYEDVIDDTTTTRTIYSNELPTKISFNGATLLLEVLYLDSSNIIDASNMFYGCTKLTNIVGIKDWDVRKITTMYMMFTSCTSLTELDLSNWEPSSLTTMYGIFYKCSKLTSIKLGKGNTPVLTSTEGMFNSCLELLSIDFGGLNVSNVNNMGGMFSDCRKLKSLDISHWDVSKVTNFGAMFRRCYSLLELNLRNWDLSSSEIISTTFEACTSLISLDLSDLVVENVSTLSGLFQSCSNLVTLNLSGWHLKKDVGITNLFNNCDKLMFVIMEHSDAFTVNKFIEALPIKSENNKGHINIKHVDDFVDVNIEEAISKYWTVFRNQGHITNIHAGYESIVNKLLHNKKIKNIYLGNSKMM